MINGFFLKLLNSPVYTSWLSLLIQSFNTVLILPLVLVNFSKNELTVWLALAVVTRFRDVFDFGLLVTISRHVAECRSNYQRSILRAYAKKIFFKVNLLAIVSLPVIFYVSLYNVLAPMEEFKSFFLCAFFVYLTCIIYLKGNYYRAYIIGINKIQLIKKHEVWVNILLLMLTVIYIVNGVGILPIVFSQMFSVFLLYFINKKIYSDFTKNTNSSMPLYSRAGELTSCAKREFFSGVLGSAFLQSVNVFILNSFSQSVANNYLIIERVVEQIKNFSRVIFYVKLPVFSKLYARHEFDDVKALIHRNYSLSLFLLVSVIWLSILSFWFIEVVLVFSFENFKLDYKLGLLFVFYALIERMTSMHNQIYLITNDHVVSHKGMFVTVFLFLFFMSLMYEGLGVYSVPLSFSIAYFVFYYWYVSCNTLSKLRFSFFKFEIFPFFALVFNSILFILLY